MQIFQSLDMVAEELKGQLVAIGNFDGLHLGHAALLSQARKIAIEKELKLIVLSFEPHPRRLFQPDDPPFRITPFALKKERLEKMSIDGLVSLPFDWNFASQTADTFVHNILQTGLNAAHVVVGADFCFGQLRKGTPQTIRAAGIEVSEITPLQDNQQEKYSSSDIRQFIRQGDITNANRMLGWEWEVRGIVQRGDRRGRELGYPTANVALGETIHPAYGIYAAWVRIEGEEKWYMAATNIGIRPMFELPVGQVEAHILEGFERDIYDQMLHIRPVKKIRGEAKFECLDDLIKQMEKDCVQCEAILSRSRSAAGVHNSSNAVRAFGTP